MLLSEPLDDAAGTAIDKSPTLKTKDWFDLLIICGAFRRKCAGNVPLLSPCAKVPVIPLASSH
jgi:hypothetical protein